MKNLSISRDSWLFKLALYGGLDDGWSRTDLCSIFWRCVWGLARAPFWTALFGSVGAGLLYLLVIDPIITLIVWFTVGVILDPVRLAIQGLFWVVLCFIGYSFWAEYKGRTNVIAAPIGAAVDGVCSVWELIVTGYRGWKNKTCVIINVVDAEA